MPKLEPFERIDGGQNLAVRIMLADALAVSEVVVMETAGNACIVELDDEHNVVAIKVQGPGAKRLIDAMEDAA